VLDFALKFLTGFFEFAHAFAESSREFRYFLRAEEQ